MSQYRVRFSPSTVNFAVRIRHRKYALIKTEEDGRFTISPALIDEEAALIRESRPNART